MSSNKRILIVDDDPDLLFLVAHSVKNLGPDFQVSTASNVTAALEQIQKQQFDLIVSDYMMPGLTGVDLAREVRQLTPHTAFILMTAHHDTSQMRSTIGDLPLAGFVGKPFTMPELLKVVKRVVMSSDAEASPEPRNSALPETAIKEQLKALRRQTGAQSVLLVNSDGTPVYATGNTDRTRISRLAMFVSANFLAVNELANLFGDNNSVFSSSYYEGNNYNIYAYNINGRFFLAVIFDAGGKPGTIWFYTKQVAAELALMLPGSKPQLSQDASTILAKDFDDLLGDDIHNGDNN